jgi:hypothetical protein
MRCASCADGEPFVGWDKGMLVWVLVSIVAIFYGANVALDLAYRVLGDVSDAVEKAESANPSATLCRGSVFSKGSLLLAYAILEVLSGVFNLCVWCLDVERLATASCTGISNHPGCLRTLWYTIAMLWLLVDQVCCGWFLPNCLIRDLKHVVGFCFEKTAELLQACNVCMSVGRGIHLLT